MTNTPVLTVHRRFRMPLAIALPAVLSLSMLLSVGPVLGAANNGNSNGSNGNGSGGSTHGTSGNLKVHDAGMGVETAGTDNEPHVCAFWLGFTLEAPYEAGTWVVVSWAPTGDGSTVASGVYDTVGDGIDNSGVIELPAGHYRVEWVATGATNSKKKTFWVDADCAQAAPVDEESQPEELPPPTDAPGSPDEGSQPEDVAPPTDAPGSPDEESQPEDVAPPTDAPGSPDEESQPEDVAPPTDAPGSPDEGSQPDELVLDGQETAPQDEAPTDEAPATEDEAPATDEEAPASDDQDVAPVEEPGGDDNTSPEDDSTQGPADADDPGQGEDSASTDPGTPPAQDELGSIGAPEGPTMSDTATPHTTAQGGPAVGLTLLLLIGVHLVSRRDRLIPSTHK